MLLETPGFIFFKKTIDEAVGDCLITKGRIRLNLKSQATVFENINSK